jgi:replicative DNA helicase
MSPDEGDKTSNEKPVKLYIAKQRNGPVGHIHLVLHKTWTKFEERPNI